MFDWAIPWTTAEVIDTAFLILTCIVTALVPVVYAFRANLRDPLARAILAGTGVTALAFNTTLGFTVALHLGWSPSLGLSHWIVRGLYLSVALGKALLLVALIFVLRAEDRDSK